LIDGAELMMAPASLTEQHHGARISSASPSRSMGIDGWLLATNHRSFVISWS
jgi:hypothetical protein